MIARVRTGLAALAAVIGILALSPAYAEAPVIQLVVDGQPLTMDVQPQIIDGRVMIPARFLAEALGATVEWDNAGQRVLVTSQAKPTPPQSIEDIGAMYREGRVYILTTVLHDLVIAKGGDGLEFDRGVAYALASQKRILLGAPITVNGRSYLEVSALVAEGLAPATTIDAESANQPTTTAPATTPTPAGPTQSTTTIPGTQPPANEPTAPVVYAVGQTITLKDMAVTVMGIRYEDRAWVDLVPNEGERFAIVTLHVVSGDLSTDPLQSPLLLVKKWRTTDGSYGSDGFAPGNVAVLRPHEDRTVEVGRVVGAGETVTGVVIGWPFGDDWQTEYTVTLP